MAGEHSCYKKRVLHDILVSRETYQDLCLVMRELADFLALQPILTAHSSALLRLMGPPCVALLNFWMWASCLHLVFSYSLPPASFLFVFPFRLFRLLSACPLPFSKERALSIPTRLSASNPRVPFTLFFYLTNTLHLPFILGTITYPVSSNVTSPKALRTLAYFISDFLIVSPIAP